MEEWGFVDDRELESFRGHKSCSTCGHFGFAVLGQCQVLGCCHLRQALLTPDYDVKKLLLRERVLTFFISKTSDTKEALGEALNAQQKLVEILVHQQFQEVREDQPASKVRQVGS